MYLYTDNPPPAGGGVSVHLRNSENVTALLNVLWGGYD